MGAAGDALRAHDALLEANASEPMLDGEGMPIDPDAWLVWRSDVQKPAYAAWSSAMDALDRSVGYSVSRHPVNFRPLCGRMIEDER